MNRALRRAGVVTAGLAVSGLAVSAAASAHPTAASAGTGTKISLHKSPQGKVLVGPGGKFVYVHVNRKKDVGCNALCKTIWPVTTTNGKPRAGKGVVKSKLGRKGNQVTYNGHLLWYYSPDPTHPSGDGANSFGGDWLLINAKGKFK